MDGVHHLHHDNKLLICDDAAKTKTNVDALTTVIWRECLSLVHAEEALCPKHSDLSADGFGHVADVQQLKLFQALGLCSQLTRRRRRDYTMSRAWL